MRAFVSGASGVIGRVVCRLLIGAGWQLSVLARPGTQAFAPSGPRVKVFTGTLADRAVLDRAARGAEIAIHLAGLLPGEPDEALAHVNVLGTANFAQSCARAGVARVVFASSTSVYRDAARPFARGITEDAPLLSEAVGAIERYGLSKVEAERRLFEAQRGGRMSVVVIRAPVVYGTKDGWDARLIETVQRSPMLTLARLPALPTLQCVHVEDLAKGIVRTATSQVAANQILNMAGPELFSFRDIGQLAFPQMAAKAMPPAPLSERLKYDIRKAQALVGYAPRARILSTAAAY